MPHAPGWTLARITIEFTAPDTGELAVIVLHYDIGAIGATFANASNMVNLLDTFVAGNVAARIADGWSYTNSVVFLDDGFNQTFASQSTPTPGTAGAPLAQFVTVIIRKRCNGTGRKRFGHTCHPGISQSFLADENNITPGTMTDLNLFYAALNNASALFGIAGAFHVIYHAALDTRDAVYFYRAHPALRTQRHRTAGRGV